MTREERTDTNFVFVCLESYAYTSYAFTLTAISVPDIASELEQISSFIRLWKPFTIVHPKS